jgi:hypothetical protein
MQKLYKAHKKNGLAILSMNRGDSVKVVKDYWMKEKFTFPPIMAPDTWHDKFGVTGYPTNYVVDKRGIIKAVFLGFDEPGLKASLKRLGVPVK